MSLILLIRHGENDWVKEQRLAGWIPDIHLNENGREQAGQLACRLAHLPIAAVYSSPVTRCMETAGFLAEGHGLPVTQLAALGEVRYGEWEGKEIKELAKTPQWYAVQHFPSRFRFPEGESFLEVQQRAVSALEALATQHAKEIIAVVSHADVIKLALAQFLGMHIDLFQRIGLSPASVSVIALMPEGGVRVLRLNDDGPLQPPPEPKDSEESDAKTGTETQTPAEIESPALVAQRTTAAIEDNSRNATPH
jgi:probable phosphoglycerate mutase